METRFRFRLVARKLLPQEFAFEPIQLWFVPAFSRCVHECQRFREHCQTCLWLSHSSMCLSEECQKIELIDLCARGMIGAQPLGHLLDPFLDLSLVRECPAVQDRIECHPMRKSLVLRKAHGGFRTLLD